MGPIDSIRKLTLLAPLLGALLSANPAASQVLPSETPAKFVPATESFDFVKREIMRAVTFVWFRMCAVSMAPRAIM
jgi:hypothetical protein